MPRGYYDHSKNRPRPATPFDEALLRRLAAEGMSTREIAAEMGGSEEMARERMIRLGIPRLPAKARMERNYFWRGGRLVDKHGYVLVKANDHPYRNAQGYVREHRLVMERKLGRYLLPHEVVDHRDEDTGNNQEGNLRLFASNAEHLAATLKGRTPDWTAEGLEQMRLGNLQKVHLADAKIDRALRSGVPLTQSQRYRLRVALRTDRLPPQRRERWLAWAHAHPPWSGTKRQSALPY